MHLSLGTFSILYANIILQSAYSSGSQFQSCRNIPKHTLEVDKGHPLNEFLPGIGFRISAYSCPQTLQLASERLVRLSPPHKAPHASRSRLSLGRGLQSHAAAHPGQVITSKPTICRPPARIRPYTKRSLCGDLSPGPPGRLIFSPTNLQHDFLGPNFENSAEAAVREAASHL